MTRLSTNITLWKILGLIILILTILISMLFYLEDIFITLIIGAVLILITEKVKKDFHVRMAERNYSLVKKRIYGYLIVFFWIFAFILIVGIQISNIGVLVSQSGSNSELSRDLYSTIDEYIPTILGQRIITQSQVIAIQDSIFGVISESLSKLSFFLFSGVLIIPLLFYVYYKRRKQFMQIVLDIIPNKYLKGFAKASSDISRQLQDFFTAKIVESIVVGSIACLGFYVIGVQGWLFLGVFVGVFNIVPYLGPLIGAIPAISVGYLTSEWVALGALITVIIAQLVDNFYLIPFMVSGKVKMDPLLSILLILIGFQFFGVFGMVLAIPIFIVYKVVIRESYSELKKIYH